MKRTDSDPMDWSFDVGDKFIEDGIQIEITKIAKNEVDIEIKKNGKIEKAVIGMIRQGLRFGYIRPLKGKPYNRLSDW